VVQRERDWRRAWELHTLRDHHLREQAKLKLQTQFKDDREKCLAKIRTYAKESKELRSQAMVLESKLEKATTESTLVSSSYERLKGSHDVQLRYLEDEANKHKAKAQALEDDLTGAKGSQRASAQALESKESAWRLKETEAQRENEAATQTLQQQLTTATKGSAELREQVGVLTEARDAATTAQQLVQREVVAAREEQRGTREELLKERAAATEVQQELSALTVTMKNMESRLTKELTAGKDENIAQLVVDLETSRAAVASSKAAEMASKQELATLKEQLAAEGAVARTEAAQLQALAKQAEAGRKHEATVRAEAEAKVGELERTVGEVRTVAAAAEAAAARTKDSELAEVQGRLTAATAGGEDRERELSETVDRLRAQATEAEEARAKEHRTLLDLQSVQDTSVSELEQARNSHALDTATWERERVELRREINDSGLKSGSLQGTVLTMQDNCQVGVCELVSLFLWACVLLCMVLV
jgi:hypothetical protein